MEKQSGFSSKLPGMIDAVGRNVKEFALRVVVHVVALVSAYLVADVTGARGQFFPLAILATYSGLVCLFARGMSLKAEWLFPACAGFIQTAACVFFGEFYAIAIFWGGVQAWLQRLVWKQGNMGSEWGALILLVPGVITLVGRQAALLPTLGAFALIAAAAWVVRSNCMRTPLLDAQSKRLKQDQSDLNVVLRTGRLAKPLEESVRDLVELLNAYTSGTQDLLPREAALLVKETGSLTSQLMQFAQRSAPQQWDPEAQGLQTTVVRISGALHRTMPQASKTETVNGKAPCISDADLAVFRSSLAELASKKHSLPLDVQGYIDGICAATENIFQCMRTDERDVKPGRKFLDRYLTAVHKVVDEHTRLSRESVITKDLADALTQSAETLKRLETAFQQEHQSLLQNDVTDFSVELGVLDKLLKMDGR